MRQKIELNAEGKSELAKAFRVTVQNVSQALLFRRNSPQAVRIREAALRKGGRFVEIHEVSLPPRTVKVLNRRGELVKTVPEHQSDTEAPSVRHQGCLSPTPRVPLSGTGEINE